MAEHHGSHRVDNDYVEHEKTYNLFVTLTKWGTVASLLIVLFAGSMTSLVPWALTLVLAVLMFVAAMML
ncbi:MAG TPA: aa3-type cytochrome c oxidase subunit IV [Beijerinckiaceae bacterium]|nr:aa3-type cytochrome c oxidase subunit IV [Beijerinckiaceae bacterium]